MSSKPTISPEHIQKIAQLAKLRLDDEMLKVYTEQINAILEHVEKLQSIDVSSIEPLSHVLDLVNVTRADVPGESLPREKVLSNVPRTDPGPPEKRATDGEFFLVPQVIKTDQ